MKIIKNDRKYKAEEAISFVHRFASRSILIGVAFALCPLLSTFLPLVQVPRT